MEMNRNQTISTVSAGVIDEGLRSHMNRVYGTLSSGLLLTFLTAWMVANTDSLLYLFHNPENLAPTILGWIAIFAPLAMIFGLYGMVQKASASAVRVFFYAFSGILGISMSSIFLAYSGATIAQVFLLTSAGFAGLSLWGYTTGRDFSGMGAFLVMGLIGLIGAMILGIFIQSSAMDFAISVIGVGIFAGLTAYDTQRIKNEYLQYRNLSDVEWLNKAATMGAMSLYLDFVNMFQFLLSLLGGFGNND